MHLSKLRNIASLIVLGVLLITFQSRIVSAEPLVEQSACFDVALCNTGATGCSGVNVDPIIRVHTVLMTLRNSLASSNVFIHECLTFPDGVQKCLVLPIRSTSSATSGYEIPNYKHDANVSVSWTQNKSMYRAALEQYCLAGLKNPTQTEIDNCDTTAGATINSLDGRLTNQNYQFHGLYHAGQIANAVTGPYMDYPVVAGSGSQFEFVSSTTGDLRRSFRVTAFVESSAVDPQANSPSDKIARLAFDSDAPVCPRTVSYDPYGQVFNKQTLEPVEDVPVYLYRKNDTLPPITGRSNYELATKQRMLAAFPNLAFTTYANPQLTTPLGSFTFYVPPGDYKLLSVQNTSPPPDRLPETITMRDLNDWGSVMDVDAVSHGTPDANGKIVIKVRVDGSPQVLYPEVYKVSEVVASNPLAVDIPNIAEQTTERRDISVTAPSAGARVVEYSVMMNVGRDYVISGYTNIPYGSVYAVLLPSGQRVPGIRTTADVSGEFVFIVPSNKVGPLESLRPVAESPNYQQVSLIKSVPSFIDLAFGWLLPKVRAEATVGISDYNPLFSHIEGYAYDESGNKLPEAEVWVVNAVLGSFVSKTTSDKNGFFTFTTEQLPYDRYELVYKPKGSTRTLTIKTAEFLTQNKVYIEENKVNLNAPKYSEVAQTYLTQHPLPSVTATQGTGVGPRQGTPGELNKGVAPTRAVQQSSAMNQLSPALLMYVAILLLLIVGAGLLIVYYMKRKQEPHLYE